ncbi:MULTISPECIES: hypothetical protein [unclassified Kribbella]|uniref:hypothetical protein n=1 Tax=unclassified Kribbella TaxID=2644121 RepID=UPI0033DC946E
MDQPRIAWLKDEAGTDLASVGGKNASLGVMLRELGAEGINVPDGFASGPASQVLPGGDLHADTAGVE